MMDDARTETAEYNRNTIQKASSPCIVSFVEWSMNASESTETVIAEKWEMLCDLFWVLKNNLFGLINGN